MWLAFQVQLIFAHFYQILWTPLNMGCSLQSAILFTWRTSSLEALSLWYSHYFLFPNCMTYKLSEGSPLLPTHLLQEQNHSLRFPHPTGNLLCNENTVFLSATFCILPAFRSTEVLLLFQSWHFETAADCQADCCLFLYRSPNFTLINVSTKYLQQQRNHVP